MRASGATKRAGFTLVETLVAGVILSGSVLALGAIGANAVADIRLNRHYETAASLIEMQLTLIDHMGIDRFVQADQTEGVFDQFEPGYQWKVSTQYRDIDDLYLVTITIMWMEGSRPHQVTAQTMLDGTGSAALPETTEQ
jgi:Tfp pilus assembly protein PilV